VLEEINSLQKKQQEDAEAYLEHLAARVRPRGLTVKTCVVVDEEPASGILVEAQIRHADLISMETHARRGLSRLFLGSVADKIVRSGTAPVLLHHPVA
jgi:nucleotide-binding universal stress UspA family protein